MQRMLSKEESNSAQQLCLMIMKYMQHMKTSGNLEDKKLHKMIDNLNPDLIVSFMCE